MTEHMPEDDSNIPADFTSQISETLKLESPCNSGSFGVVYRRTIKLSKGSMEVAVKVFKIDPGRTIEKIEKTMRRELLVWLRLKHSTIVPLLGTANVDSPFPALVSQWMSFGTLYMYLEQASMTVSAKVELAIGVADGLNYLHSENVIHGDLHPANVLVDNSGNPRLTDFGLATVAGDAELQLSNTTATRTLDSRWRAPEIVGIERDPEKPSFTSDMFSFGGVMFFILSEDIPWKEKNPVQICIALSQKVEHTRPDNILDDHWSFIQKCWSWDPKNRPDAADAIKCIALKNVVISGKLGAEKSSTIPPEMVESTIQTIRPEMTERYPLHIYGITVDFSKSKLNVESAEVRISKSHLPIEYEAGRGLRHTFSPAMELAHGDTFSLHISHKKWVGMKHEDIILSPDDVLRVYSVGEREEYIKFHKRIRIVIHLSESTTTEQADQSGSSGQSLELWPTTPEIFRKCPRFRILVIGKTGVGKSSLINYAFGVEKLIASHDKPGNVSIDDEFMSPWNDKFILHDSKGFEPGEEDNLKIVQYFIERRRNIPTPEHQLHAIWLCFEIPRAGGCLLERGTEEFLKLKSSGTLGNIPVVVVLTKYDMLIDRMERTIDETSLSILSNEAIKELAKTKAEAELQDICIGPLQRLAGPDIPHVKISIRKCYKETITHLIQVTENCVGLHSTPEAAVMTSIPQRVHPGLTIKASIEVGKRTYWKALASSTSFKNRKMWDCLYVLHTDIVNVWNFYDSHHYLRSQEFRELIVKMVDKVEVGPTANPTKTIHTVLQRFMSYIVHLTLVLQTLYYVSERQGLTRRVIKLAVAFYLDSPMSGEVITWIQEYDKRLTILERPDRDALDEIVEVMQFYSIDAAQMSELRNKIPHLGPLPDEPW